jgi:hypothetical protein
MADQDWDSAAGGQAFRTDARGRQAPPPAPNSAWMIGGRRGRLPATQYQGCGAVGCGHPAARWLGETHGIDE